MPENRLALEASPYLLQHKDNPVAWYPWSEEAFERARSEGKPVLLSVGYAACHWCHVMAHECFEEPAIAALMNRLFVNIKVDREERPDLDTIYQAALALLGQQGGWPLTMFLTAEGKPFWGGTYFPPEDRYGRPGFPKVLEALAEVYGREPDKVAKNVEAIGAGLTQLGESEPGGQIPTAALDPLARQLAQHFDPLHGGFGEAPKFPHVPLIELVWRAWLRTGEAPLKAAVTTTLTAMSQGGIYDHLGGGFARYSVDAVWLVPHFEKMLYDNAELVRILTLVWQGTGDALYEARVRETIGWLLREMIAEDAEGRPSGAFAATLDADSEGEEGRFYVWSEAEIDRILGTEAPFFKKHYDVTAEGNWEGKVILNRTAQPALADAEGEAALARGRERLLAARGERVRPGWDDKVLADWNGLMIRALAEAALAFREPAWLEAAERAFAFVLETLRDPEGRLLHAWRRGRAGPIGMLDDHAALARAALALHEATGEAGYLEQALDLVAALDERFADPAGGYFLTAADAESLIVRTKHAHDNPTPSGNGLMLEVFAHLHHLTGEAIWREKAEALQRAVSGGLERGAVPYGTLLNAAEVLNEPVRIVVLGRRGEAATDALLEEAFRHSVPSRILQVVEAISALPSGHPAAGKAALEGRPTAYVCQGQSCSLPVTEAKALEGLLKPWTQ